MGSLLGRLRRWEAQKGTWIVTEVWIFGQVTSDVPFEPGRFPFLSRRSLPKCIQPGAGNVDPATGGSRSRLSERSTSWISTLGTVTSLTTLTAPGSRTNEEHWRENPPSKYEYVAASVDGVVSSKVIRAPRGYGSTDVLITSVEGLPSMELLQSVRAALDSYGSCAATSRARPGAVTCDVNIEYEGSATAEAVGLAARQYILSLASGRSWWSEVSTRILDRLQLRIAGNPRADPRRGRRSERTDCSRNGNCLEGS